MQRRSWIEMNMDVLDAASTPSNKTRLMYKCNMNFDRFNKHFQDLLRKGFLEEINDVNGQAMYKITERGRTLLEVLKKARELVFSDGP